MDKQIIALTLFFIGLVVRELWNSNGRSRLHRRIDDLNNKYTTKELCDERSKNIEDKLNEIATDVKWLRDNGKK